MKNQYDPVLNLEKKMQVGVLQCGAITHIKPQGRMVYEHSSFYAEQLKGLLLKEKGLYMVDVDMVERIDSTGFGVLINFARLINKQGGKIGFVVGSPFLRELFLMARFDKVFPVAETLNEATNLLLGDFAAQIILEQY